MRLISIRWFHGAAGVDQYSHGEDGINAFAELLPEQRFRLSTSIITTPSQTKKYAQIRDFLILHYRVNTREDSEFWKYCREMEVPESLQIKLDLFASNGRILRENEELFPEDDGYWRCK